MESREREGGERERGREREREKKKVWEYKIIRHRSIDKISVYVLKLRCFCIFYCTQVYRIMKNIIKRAATKGESMVSERGVGDTEETHGQNREGQGHKTPLPQHFEIYNFCTWLIDFQNK